jgi:NADH:ubiquinone reductase (H+-translocating)
VMESRQTRASSLTAELPLARDRLGRVTVDDFLRVTEVAGVFAAGDVAAAPVNSDHLSVNPSRR